MAGAELFFPTAHVGGRVAQVAVAGNGDKVVGGVSPQRVLVVEDADAAIGAAHQVAAMVVAVDADGVVVYFCRQPCFQRL